MSTVCNAFLVVLFNSIEVVVSYTCFLEFFTMDSILRSLPQESNLACAVYY